MPLEDRGDRGHEQAPHDERVEEDPHGDGEPERLEAPDRRGQQRRNVPARMSPAEVITWPVSARPRAVASRVVWSAASSRIRDIRKML